MSTEGDRWKCHRCGYHLDGRELFVFDAMDSKCVACGFDKWRRCPGCSACDEAKAMNEGTKHDQGKAPFGLLPGVALRKIAEVLRFGADKYAPNGWKTVRPGHRYLDAALRHLHAFADGEDMDEESGLGHLAHAGCCVLFLIVLHDQGVPVRWSECDRCFQQPGRCDREGCPNMRPNS